MLTLIGNLGQPLACLAIHVVKIGELTQWPEVLAEVTDGAFDFSLFPSTRRIAGSRVETVLAREAEKARKKTDQLAIMFCDRGGKVVIDDLAGDTTQRSERVDVTANESFKTLAMRELDVEHTAMRIDQREGVEFALITGIIERAEVSPVHFKAFAGKRLHAYEGAFGRELRTNFLHILLQDAGTTGVTERTQSMLNDCGGDAWIFLQPFGNLALERIEFTYALALDWPLRRSIQILLDGFPAHVEMALDFANRPVFGPVKPVQVVDLLSGQHCSSVYPAKAASKPEGCCLQDEDAGFRGEASASITNTCAGAELLFARNSAPAPTSQTAAAECFRSRAEVLFARLCRCCLRSRSFCCWRFRSTVLGCSVR